MRDAASLTLSCRSFVAVLPALAATIFSACSQGGLHQGPASHAAAIYGKDGQRLPDYMASSDAVDWQTLTSDTPHYLDWNGVGTMTPGCTATALAKPEAGKDGAVYLITAGHCFIRPSDEPSTVLVDQATSQRVQLGKYVDGSGAPEPVRLRLERIVYATMSGTDVSIVRASGITYAELVGKGVHPLVLGRNAPVAGTAIVIPQEPLEGVFRPGMRLASCTVGATADLREEPFHSEGAFRNHCSSVGGTSGAPVVDAASREIIGVLTTGTRDITYGQPDCVDSRPCEVQPGGNAMTFPDENYAQHVFQFASCFDQRGEFSLQASGCKPA